MSPQPSTARSIWLPYALDIFGPLVAYYLVHWFGGGAVVALTLGGLVAGVSTSVNTIRRKGLDRVGVLVILEISASIALLVLVRDPRLLLIRPSFYTAIAACYLMFTAFVGVPLSYIGARPMATKGDPARAAAYERAWEGSAEFRRTHRLVTFGLSVAFLVDSVARVVIVYTVPFDRAAWLSSLPHVSAIVLFVGVSALAGRKFARIVDQFQAR